MLVMLVMFDVVELQRRLLVVACTRSNTRVGADQSGLGCRGSSPGLFS